jgi:hypothetical protein
LGLIEHGQRLRDDPGALLGIETARAGLDIAPRGGSAVRPAGSGSGAPAQPGGTSC